jgi:hypothetical protein
VRLWRRADLDGDRASVRLLDGDFRALATTAAADRSRRTNDGRGRPVSGHPKLWAEWAEPGRSPQTRTFPSEPCFRPQRRLCSPP